MENLVINLEICFHSAFDIRLDKKKNGRISQSLLRSRFIHVREISEKFFFFFKVKELSGNSVIFQEKMKCCKNVREFYISA